MILKKKKRVKTHKTGHSRSGQIMLLSVMIIGGVMLSAAAVGSLLVRHQLRQVNDSIDSAKAFFAADTGIEVSSFCYFKGCGHGYGPDNPPPVVFQDGSVSFEVSSILGPGSLTITSRGFAGKTVRALEAVFTN